MKDEALGKDEYDALAQIAEGMRGGRPSACVARNSKRLAGLKFVAYGKDGSLALTEKGEQTLFIRACIDGMRAVATDPLAVLTPDVKLFLGKKGHITPRTEAEGFELTLRGQESLADIDMTAR
ncbi:MAG: hypothetical protein H7234_04610 [Herminiimonas sp.]|nr:hypothetical protein [Herminiimonas sp.]